MKNIDYGIDEEHFRQEERIRIEERQNMEEERQRIMRTQQEAAFRQFTEKIEKERAERKAKEQREKHFACCILASCLFGGIPYAGWPLLILCFCYCLRGLIQQASVLSFVGTLFCLFALYVRYWFATA